MRVLIVSQYYWPEDFRINDVVKTLVEKAIEVEVLTGKPNYPRGDIFNGYRAWGCQRETHHGVGIHRTPLWARGRSGWRLALNYLSFVISGMLFAPLLLRGRRFDVIFVYAPSPILQAIPAIFLGWLKGCPVVLWVQDLWPESLSATGYVRNPRMLAMVAVLVRWIYRRCDLLLVQSQAFIPPVKVMAGKTPVLYHPNPGELAFDEQPQPLGSQVLVLEQGFNVVFAGNLGTVQALGAVLDAAELLLPHSEVRIVLVGSGSRSEWLQQEVLRRQLDNVQLAGRFAPEAMPGILGQASALLVSLVRSPIMSQTVPSKVQAYLAAGKPIIASLDGEGARVLEESGAGVSCPAEDAVALAQAVLRLRAMPSDELQRMGEAGQLYYKQHFDPEVLVAKLVKHFSQVLAGNKP